MAIKLIRERSKDRTSAEAKVEFTIDEDISWPDLLKYMEDFIRGCGYILPKGELEFVKDSEVVLPKAEVVLYGKKKVRDDDGVPF